MSTSHPSGRIGLALALLIAFVGNERAYGKIDNRPRPVYMFKKGDRFITPDSRRSLALYAVEDGKRIRRFAAAGLLDRAFAVSADEKFLAAGGDEIAVWNVETGEKLWSAASATARGDTVGSFAHNGKSLTVHT